MRFGREAFQRLERGLQRSDQPVRLLQLVAIQPGSRLRAVQRRCLPAPEFGEFIAKPFEIPHQAGAADLRPGAAQQRQFQRLDRAPVRAGFATEPAQRMLQQRQQGRRLQLVGDRFGCEARKNAGRNLHQRIAAGIVEQQVPAAERRHHPPRQRAVRCHQRRRFAQMPRLAHCDCDRQRFHFGIGGLDHREIGHAARDVVGDTGIRQPRMPLRRSVRRPHRLRRQHIAAMARGRAQDFDIAALDAEALQQRVHGELRMVGGRRRSELAGGVADAADQLPGGVVQICIEPRQHHGALRQRCDGVQEFRGHRHRAGRARRDHGPVMMRGQARGFGLDQLVAPRRRFDPAALVEDSRPDIAGDGQELQRQLPVFVERIRHQAVERAPVDLARHHVIHQPRQIVGQRQRRIRSAGHQRRLRRIGGPDLPCPRRDQLRQQQPALQAFHCRR